MPSSKFLSDGLVEYGRCCVVYGSMISVRPSEIDFDRCLITTSEERDAPLATKLPVAMIVCSVPTEE